MPITFLQLAQKVLSETKQALSPNEIWEWATQHGYEKDVGSNGKTPIASLGARLYVELRDNPSSPFTTTDTRPKKFYLKNVGVTPKQLLESQKPEKMLSTSNYLEKHLHPLLVYFGTYSLKAYLKTIHHQKSERKDFGEWLHPDVVGCYFPFSDWKNEVVEVSSLLGNPAVKFFSFEIKREINFSNLRESFFQAVSNSSWANEGFLVAAEISQDIEFRKELERLSSSFGIGIISLNTKAPDSSEVLFPAKIKDFVDWDNVDKLARMNSDFRGLLERVKIDIQSREVRQEKYDKVLSAEEIISLINH